MMKALPRQVSTLVLGALLLPSLASGDGADRSRPLLLGYTTFDSPAEVRTAGDATLRSLEIWLQDLADRSADPAIFPRPLDFEITLGNYYQIVAWLREGQIDGALVSPFMAHLLASRQVAFPVVEFRRTAPGQPLAVEPAVASGEPDSRPAPLFCPDRAGEVLRPSPRGHWPLIAASRHGVPSSDPRSDFDGFLAQVEADTVDRLDGLPPREDLGRYQVQLVTHLSTTGFLAPLGLARSWPEDAFGEARHSSWGAKKRRQYQEAFWETLFAKVRFSFKQGAEPEEQNPSALTLRFSYSDRNPEGLRRDQERLGLGCWQPYFTADGPDEPPMPNDVLVLRPEAVERTLGIAGLAARSREVGALLLWGQPEPLAGGGEGYVAAAVPDSETWKRFESRVLRPLEESPGLRPFWIEWYEEGQYTFLPVDVIRFLEQDQRNSGTRAMALVLPGGGVKSAYQARLLDDLYQRHYLINRRSESPAAEPGPPLEVDHIVGTSGGAMMGFLAAQIPPGGQENLTERWRGQLTSTFRVFPFFNLLRWGSVLGLLYLLSFLLNFGARLRETSRKIGSFRGDVARPPWLLIGVLLAPVVLAPLAMAALLEEENRVTLAPAGGIYLAILLITHFGLACTVARKEGASTPSRKRGALALSTILLTLGGLLLTLSILAWFTQLGWIKASWNLLPGAESFYWAFEVGLGFLLIQLGTLTSIARREGGAALLDVGLYGQGMGVLVAYIAFVDLLMYATYRLRATTLLEMTGLYWIWLGGWGLAVGLALAVLGSKCGGSRPRSFLHQAFAYLVRHESRGFVLTTPKRSLLLILTFGFFWWSLCLGHALYTHRRAWGTFADLAGEVARHWGEERPRFHANLVVTTSALDDSGQNGDPGHCPWYPAGASFFCFDSPDTDPCPTRVGPRWHRVEIPAAPGTWREPLLGPIFASGSPFPVFPPYLVELADSCDPVPMVDGGFAHLEPLEAAGALKARQVLVIRSQPDPHKLVVRGRGFPLFPFPSRLARGLGNLFPFLFERSQELDRSAGRSLVVAVLEPHPDHGEFPLLTDFRPQVVDRMIAAAEKDWSRMIGKIDSWGLPEVFRRIPAR